MTPPPPARDAITAQQCRRLDREAVDAYGIPILLLMEHAGMAIAQAVRRRFPKIPARLVCLAGCGHNGGDGLAAVRLLHAAGYPSEVFLLGRRSTLRDAPALYARILERLEIPVHECVAPSAWEACGRSLAQAEGIIDAVLGTGCHGALRPEAEQAIRLMNAAGHPVLAVDTPSGLNVDTGAVDAVAVRATVTVTFGLPKQGFFRAEGPRHVGELIVDEISFPPALLAQARSR